ncbi:unnamed protein product [Rotaria sordida]|uniref:NHL repeat-containing protein n=1 Tax=Rotaria sordida TaxID=392033 RepID=A0A815QF26_9BILA|nr:unnamed protein product [Rotaria sordida]CAF1641970.1 unnamed protein product [Rotaria sordida]
MYIVDSGNNRILRWPPNSIFGECIVACTGTVGIEADKLYIPIALAFDSYGSLFISEGLNNRVQKFQIVGSFDSSSTIISTSTITTTTTTITDHTTSLEASSESSKTHSTTVAVSIAVLVVLC